jgi:hypothetical protein
MVKQSPQSIQLQLLWDERQKQLVAMGRCFCGVPYEKFYKTWVSALPYGSSKRTYRL